MSATLTSYDVFTTRQDGEWSAALDYCAPFDFYHLPFYHALAEEQGEGTARLFVYRQGEHRIALPLLLRDLDGLWDGASLEGWRDASSVYGYAGPVFSPQEIPAEVISGFQSSLAEWLREERVVNVFCRLHPLLQQRPLLAGLGDYATSQTVSIDLTLPLQAQRSGIRRSFREAINKQQRHGLTCIRDADGSYLEDFCRIYHQTMRRVNAADRYYFPLSYFERLRDGLGARMNTFVCLLGGKPVCAGLFIECHGTLQYHLGGTLDEALALAPMKLLVDGVRQWATGQGLRVLHLGGGTTTSPEDPLLYFKRGFSDRFHEFAAWRWIVIPDVHQRLCAEKAHWNEQRALQPTVPHFFPAYRCECTPRQESAAPGSRP